MTINRPTLLSAVASLTASIVLGAPASAVAAEDAGGGSAAADFDVWLSASDVRIGSGACRSIPFTVSHNAGYLDRFTAAAEVWRGGQYLDQTFDYLYESPGPLTGEYTWCPSTDGVGQFRLGPTAVEWDRYDADQEGAFDDPSVATFWVKQDQRCSLKRAKKSHGRLAVSAKARWYSLSSSRWQPSPRGAKLKLQRLRPTGWRTVKAARIGKGGVAQLSIRAPRTKQTYRVVQGGTAQTWGCSATFLR